MYRSQARGTGKWKGETEVDVMNGKSVRVRVSMGKKEGNARGGWVCVRAV